MKNEVDVKSVWKYPLGINDEQTIEIPHGSELLSLMEQKDEPVLYYLVDPLETRKDTIHISMRGTGQLVGKEMTSSSIFLGTVNTHRGRLVWHIWKRG